MSDSAHSNQTDLEKLLRKGKPWLEENGTVLIYFLAAVLAIAAIVVYVNRKPEGDLVPSQALLLATTPEDFRDIADAHPDTAIGIWARLREADRLLDNAVSNMFTDRKTGLEELNDAQSAYDRLAERSDIDASVLERVLIGLARLAETRCDGTEETTNAAVSAWKRVLDEFPDSLVKDHAEERIEHLPSKASQAFYAWFSKQNPSPALPGLEPGQPNVPDVPDIDLDSLLKGNNPHGASTDTPETKANSDKETDEDKTTSETENADAPETPAVPESESKDTASGDEKETPAPKEADQTDTPPEPEPDTSDAPIDEGDNDGDDKSADAQPKDSPEADGSTDQDATK